LHVLHRAAEKIDDLVQFSVSDDYGKLRRALGIARVG
jgi:hypothetical protein